MNDAVETEWQFESAAPPDRWLRRAAVPEDFVLGSTKSEAIVDVYYETADWRLVRAGYALRLRTVGNRREVTLKHVGAPDATPRRRRELTTVVDLSDADVAPARMLERVGGPLADRIAAITGAHPVHALVELRTGRRVAPILRHGRVLGELALDVTQVVGDDGSPAARLYRVEVELAPGVLDAELEPFVTGIGTSAALKPATHSKLDEALRARDLVPVLTPDLGPTEVDETMVTGAVALAALRRSFAALLEHEPGTRVGDDPEALHQMRVATRRLRATLALFADVLPVRIVAYRGTIGWLADALGSVRDLDVQLARLEGWRTEMTSRDADALETLVALLRRRRLVARRTLLRVLDCPRYDRFVARFATLLRTARPRGDARLSIVATAPALIRKRMRRMREAADAITESSPPPAYHAVRILCKKLRYALEAHADVYGTPLARVVDAVAKLQKLLGRHQDSEVAVAQLRALSERRGSKRLPSHAVFVIGKIAERYEREARRLRRRFPKRYARVTGGRWKKLRRVMEKSEQVVERHEDDRSRARRKPPAIAPVATAPVVVSDATVERRTVITTSMAAPSSAARPEGNVTSLRARRARRRPPRRRAHR